MYIYTCMYITVSNIIYFQSTTESHIHRQLSGISRHLDVDGLTIFSDPVQQRMAQMKSDYERQIQVLTAQLDEARIALIQHASACNGAGRCILDNFRDDMVGFKNLLHISL